MILANSCGMVAAKTCISARRKICARPMDSPALTNYPVSCRQTAIGGVMATRREFLDALAVGTAGLAIGTTAKSYGQILGSNDRLNFAVIGLNGRGYAHLSSLKASRSAARISHVCDVDTNILNKFAGAVQKDMGYAPATDKDFRHVLQ